MATINTLTDRTVRAAIKAAQGASKPRRISDGAGLFLDARPTGAGWWRFRYQHNGREGMLSLGTYPDVPLAAARVRRDELRRLLADGQDPSQARKANRADRQARDEAERLAAAGQQLPGSFEHVARRWFALRQTEWAARYASKIIGRLENHAFPRLGARPVAQIQPPELLELLRRCEASGTVETAHRLRDTCSQVFRFAITEGLATTDPARDLAGALRQHTTRHLAAITDPKRFGALLLAVDAYPGTPVVRAALQLAALVFLRPGQELRAAMWAEFDLDGATWVVPAERLKRRKEGKANGPDHLVPLSRQAVAILRELQPLTVQSGYVFQGIRRRRQPISENTLNAALDTLGFTSAQHRAHGFRASARTMLHERLHIDPNVIEAQLAHSVPDALGRAYNRTSFAQQRRTLMQQWADYLDTLRQAAAASRPPG